MDLKTIELGISYENPVSQENPVSYETDAEYREQIRRFCQMKCVDKFENDPTIDPISRDENLIDDTALSNTMDILYDKTRDSIAFKVLFNLAAGRMFSENPEIGLCILMSYDYFRDFYIVYRRFLEIGEGIETDANYIVLKNKLG